MDLFVTKALSYISDINDHVISVTTSIKYFRERRQKTPKIHQWRIVLKKFGQKFFQAVFLHGEVLFPTFFYFSDVLNIPAAGILRHVRHYLVNVHVWNQRVQFFNSCFMFFVVNITTDFLIKNKHFRRLIDFEERDKLATFLFSTPKRAKIYKCCWTLSTSNSTFQLRV